ncbi:hypothetical protein [Streptomyces sp. NPDC020965]|uniref:hypothetical protein n=1 Tax=Streptomyces sp. NPDC020965 TaxID=3365105 RepID=UPI00379D3327
MAGSAKDFCSDLVDLSGVSLAQLHSSEDPALRRSLSWVDHRATAAFAAQDEANSEEMRLLRRPRSKQR